MVGGWGQGGKVTKCELEGLEATLQPLRNGEQSILLGSGVLEAFLTNKCGY